MGPPRSTRGVDALWRPHGAVLDEAWRVADELGLPRWWLNEQASFYLPPGTGLDGASLFEGAALRVMQASPELLLAMKVRAARTGDRADIRFLADLLSLHSSLEVIELAESVFDEPVGERQRQVVEDVVDR